MKCGACKEIFCSEHFGYVKHECPEPNTRDVQVPDCPLCGAPVPGRRGEPPDVAVGAHIDNQCTSDPAKERRKKSDIPKNSRILWDIDVAVGAHIDNQCTSDPAKERRKKTEDEALAHALAMSMRDENDIQTRDTNFARALLRQRVGGEQNSRCSVS
ncbi:AN1-type zinc finger protein 2B [Papilio machaon]|uniref:AN1-type zinc finger protein 2B n=1 Tax=Papilio machaon TaxID=76193 RepID=A0A0N0PE15_PAPMA|nr:AN1-type zinc finger protein 2B [Papilio machaon]